MRPILLKLRRLLVPAVTAGAVLLLWWAGRDVLAEMTSIAAGGALAHIPAAHLVQAGALTALAYALLSGYDLLALRQAGAAPGLGRTVLASFEAYGLSHTLGFAALTGHGVRTRFWSSWGLDAPTIAVAIAFASLTFLVGVVSVTGLALLVVPSGLPMSATWLMPAGRGVGVALLVLVGVYLIACGRGRGAVVVWGRTVSRPTRLMAILQVALGVVDWAAAAAVLYVLLPTAHRPGFVVVAAAFVLAQLLALVSHVPGGLGVFEGLMVALAGDRVDTHALVAALVAFRIVYYLVPFAAAAAILVGREAWLRRHAVRRALHLLHVAVRDWARPLLPSALGTMTLCGGAVLLVSGATPAVSGRLRILVDLLPLGIVELSHFTGSVAGAALLVIGWALTRKLDAAWTLACVFLSIGIAATLLKGLDWEEAVALATILVVLVPNRALFYRRSSLTTEPLTAGWIVAIGLSVGASLWVGFFAYRHVEFDQDLWWHVAVRGDAPRFLRATVGVVTTLGLLGLVRLMRHGRVVAPTPDERSFHTVRSILPTVTNVEANLALLGDKAFLLSDAHDAFLMYAVRGRSWVALHEPFGNPRAARELLLRFMAIADRAGGWPVLYQVGPDLLPLCIELGYTLLKVGEEAFVPLDDFSLEGGRRKNLRRSHRDALRGGATFEVVPRDGVDALLPELARVSDAWLAGKATQEKGFSLGIFDEAYLRNFDVAVVRAHGRIVAFANVLTAGSGDYSADLMRQTPDCPDGTMDFLFCELLMWGRAQGFRRMGLGMAPLSGLMPHAVGPRWARLASAVYRHAEPVYNFQGLRRYKEKFDPEWEPRYLAITHRLALPRILLDVMTLISGGVRGLVAR